VIKLKLESGIMRHWPIIAALLLAACSNATSVDGLWLLDIVATREAKGYQTNVSADPNTEMALNFLAQTESELHISDGKFHYLGLDCQIQSVGDKDAVSCKDKQGKPTTRTLSLKDNQLWLVSSSGYPEIFVRAK